MPKSCVFCSIAAGSAPAYVVDENELALALLDIQPFSEGHCLVIAKRHEPWWNDLNDAEIASLFTLAKGVGNRLRSTFDAEFVCMYARGRRVPHTHIFLVPVHEGDVLDRMFNDLERLQETSSELAPLRSDDALRLARSKIQRSS